MKRLADIIHGKVVSRALLLLCLCICTVLIPDIKIIYENRMFQTGAIDTEWNGGFMFQDSLLLSLIKQRRVRIHPESPYINYVRGYAAEVWVDENAPNEVPRDQIENAEEYTFLGKASYGFTSMFTREFVATEGDAGIREIYMDLTDLDNTYTIEIFVDEMQHMWVKGYHE